MKKPFFLIILYLLLQQVTFALDGKIERNKSFKSEILNEVVLYNVYLPQGYDHNKTYPVLFYLHWFGGDNNSSKTVMSMIDSLISINEMPELIVVTPNAKIGWYLDDYNGDYKYSSMFLKEFIPLIENEYSISADRTQRAVMGSSMGGFGALRFTMLYHDQFGLCFSFMGGMSTKEQIVNDNDDDYKKYHQNIYGNDLKGKDRANEYFIKNNPLYIAESLDLKILNTTKWYLQTCDDDYHSLPNIELHALFHKLGVKHEFRVDDGVHDGDCVMCSIFDSFKYLSKWLNFNIEVERK